MIWKGLFILLAVLVLQIPILLVNLLISDREQMSSETVEEISGQYGGKQTIYPPELKLPYKIIETGNKGETVVKNAVHTIAANDAEVTGNVQVETLHRSIYDANVYQADLNIEGSFVISSEDMSYFKDKIYMCLTIGEMRGLEDNIVAVVDGKEYMFDLADDGLRAEIKTDSLAPGQIINYSIGIKTKGARSMRFRPDSKTFKVNITSDHPAPSFGGTFLPNERNITNNGFDAQWTITEFNTFGVHDPSFYVDMIVPVSQYLQTTRATKYSFLIILLVFMAIFLVETISRQEVHYIQYVVTGFSLCLFYLLLLSLAEYLSFSWAYLIASGMTVMALGGYFIGFLKSKTAIGCTAAVTVLYAFIYLLLNLETGSLLVGSLALFFILCLIMYFTRKNLSLSRSDDE